MVAELILIPDSDEALEGAKACARSVARALSGAGITVKEQISVCAGRLDLQKAVATALGRSNIVLTLGGLGRESGGLVKTVVAQGLSLPIEVDGACYAAIQEYCDRRGEPFLPGDAALAQVPKGSRVFPGVKGRTPGLVISSASQHIVMLPDNEKEALPLLRDGILSLLSGTAPESAVTRTLRTYGVSEDMVRRTVAELLDSQNPSVAVQKEGNEVLVEVTGRAGVSQQAAALCTPVLRRCVELLGDAAYGLDVDSLQAAVVDKLSKKELGLAIAESGSGGMLTRVVGEAPGGADALRYSVAVDTDKTKWEKLGVPYKLLKKHGGCSEEATVFIADAARKKAGAELGVALSVGQGYDRKNPLGLVYIAVCDARSVYVKKLIVGDGHPEERDLVVDAALSRALNMLRLFIDYLPDRYMGAIPLEEALKGRTVTDQPGQGDAMDISERSRQRVGFWRRLGRNFMIRKSDRAGVKVRKVIFIIAILVFLGSAGYVGKYYYDAWAAKNLAVSLADMYTYGDIAEAEVPEDYPDVYLDKFAALYGVNSDVVGFVSIPDTPMAYPVVQAGDNDYYLRKDYYQNYSEYGIPFMDFRVDVQKPSDNMVIYGHNMKDAQIFGELLNYNVFDKTLGKDGALAYFREHPVVDFATVYNENSYAIFSVFITNAYENQGHVFDYHNFIDASSDEDLLNFAYQLEIRSIIDTGVDFQPGDKLITLSTCTYEFTDARFVVAARQLRPGEAPEDFGREAEANPRPLMPDIWYSLYGGTPPTGLSNRSSVITTPAAAASGAASALGLEQAVTQPEIPPEEEEGEEEPPIETSPPEILPPPESSQPESPASSSQPVPLSSADPAPPPQVMAAQPASSRIEQTPAAGGQASGEDPYEDYTLNEGYLASIADKYQDYVLDEGTATRSQTAQAAMNNFDGDLMVTAGGQKITGDALDLISRVVQNEVGASFHAEAIKAQAVAAFTYISFYNQSGTAPSVALSSKADQKVIDAVSQVLGEAVWYGGKLALTPYHATSAGATASSRDVWGGHYAYLVSVDSELDTGAPGYQATKTMSYDQVYSLLERHLGTSPDGEPDSWFEIQSYADGGYVGDMRIWGRTTAKNGARLTGRYVRESILGLRSAAFEVEYDYGSDRFIFTTYGYGHGVGLSQNGANLYAKAGWDYAEILTHYYPGTAVS